MYIFLWVTRTMDMKKFSQAIKIPLFWLIFNIMFFQNNVHLKCTSVIFSDISQIETSRT